ncbi:MAG: glycosyltransferase family 4 protein [Deltaproteobacteria bacterium]|jgi:UDP-glucose:(heptosyl)LPS alpha-1,3-glucosyltransferase|nr:glycosyltransferase family 4 protein [Deltaproteobacteria bacterium]
MQREATPRIAIMLPIFSRYGGAEQFALRLSAALAQKGFAVDFICARQEAAAPDGVTVLKTGRPFGPRWLKGLYFAFKAEQLRKKGNYDCTFTQGKVFSADIFREGGGPLLRFWSCTDPSFPAGIGRLWKKFTRILSPYNWFTYYIEKKLYLGQTKITANSHFVRDLILADYPHFRAEDIEVIYNRPDLSLYHAPDAEERRAARAAFDIAPRIKAVGFASGSFQRKGLTPLIRALALLPEEYHLYIASGSNPGAYRKLSKALGLEERVHFVGRVDNTPVFYRALDIYVQPTFCDACSNAVLEAAASGLPVISTRFDGSAYFLPENCVLDNPGDSVKIAQGILLHLSATATENKTPSFAGWPEAVPAGMDAWVALIERYLDKKRQPLK